MGARAGQYKLGTRADKYKFGARAGSQAKGRGPENTNTHTNTLFINFVKTNEDQLSFGNA